MYCYGAEDAITVKNGAGEDEQLLHAAVEELEQRPLSSDSDAAVDGQEELEEAEDVVAPTVEAAARAGGARPEGGGARRRSKLRADRRGAAEPLVRSGLRDPHALGLVEVPDANHEALHAMRWEDAIMWGSPSEDDDAEPDALAGMQPRSPEAEADDRDTSLVSDQTADAAAAAAGVGVQNGLTASMDWAAFAVPNGGDRQNGAQPAPDDFEALLASVGIPMPGMTGGLVDDQPLQLLGPGGGGGARMKRYPLASNAVLEPLPIPGAPHAVRSLRPTRHAS